MTEGEIRLSDGTQSPLVTTTEGWLLGGRVRYAQPAQGFRSSIEPVLLAASIPASPGDHVLEAGTGAGALLLCLAARVGGLTAIGLERDAMLAQLARRNALANGFRDLFFAAADISASPLAGQFDHACANPPYHVDAGTASPVGSRDRAKRATPDLISVWVGALGRRLRPRGTLTLIWPARGLPACLRAMTEAGCRPSVVFPFWPKPEQPAKLILVRGIKGGRMPLRLLPGMILHDNNGAFTTRAELVLRGGAALSLDCPPAMTGTDTVSAGTEPRPR